MTINRTITTGNNNSNNMYNNYLYNNEVNTGHASKLQISTIKKISNSVCKLTIKNFSGTGFFLKISNSFFLISNEHVLTKSFIDNKEILAIETESGVKYKLILDKNSTICFPKPIDVTAIRIKEDTFKDIEFLNLDMNYFNGSGFQQYFGQDVYSIQYPGDKSSSSIGMGKITLINDFTFEHFVDTFFGSSGSPIILSSSNNVIGIHKSGNSQLKTNYGTFLGKIFLELLK